MTDVKLLPLPEPCPQVSVAGDHDAQLRDALEDYFDADAVETYARAVAEHNVKERDAEIARLQEEIDNRWAQGVHSCNDNCQRVVCVQRREIEALREEVRQAQALARDERHKQLKSKLRAERLAEALREARDAIEDWAGYASDYFREKHDLAGDLAKIDVLLRDQEEGK